MNDDLGDDELAAVMIAIARSRADERATTPSAEISPWSLAMRRSDLEFDDLLLLKSACSQRF